MNFLEQHEFDTQVSAVRLGLSKVIPLPLLSLFTGPELEVLVCGSAEIPLPLLKSVTTYKGKFRFHFEMLLNISIKCYVLF